MNNGLLIVGLLSTSVAVTLPQNPGRRPTVVQPFRVAESVAPVGATLPGTNRVAFSNGVYRFSFLEGARESTVYEIDTGERTVVGGGLRVREGITGAVVVSGGGSSYRKRDETVLSPAQLSQAAATTFRHWRSNDSVSLDYAEELEGKTTHKRFELGMSGKTLIIRVYAVNPDASPRGNYAGFSFGRSEQADDPHEVSVPYMELHPIVMAGPRDGRFFYSTYVDWTRSGSNAPMMREGPVLTAPASFRDSFASAYIPAQGDIYPPLDETAYVTVSRDVLQVMPRIRRSPSTYRHDLNDRVIWDAWGTAANPQPPYTNRFKEITAIIKTLRTLRMDRVAVIVHAWQSRGYDCGLPIHYPANPDYGGDADLRAMTEAAGHAGFLFALHMQFAQIYENSGDYWANGANVALGPDGQRQLSNPARECPTLTSYRLRSDKMAAFAAKESRLTKAEYRTTSGFLDVTTSFSPDSFIDYAATNPNARTVRDGFANTLRLNDAMHTIHRGPLFGEGGTAPMYQAGSVDAVEAELAGKELAPVIPDFALRELKPLMANHGLGYYGRFPGSGLQQLNRLELATYPWDKYRATQLAFGHAGFMSDAHLGKTTDIREFYRHWIKEFYTFRGLQADYLSSPIASVQYASPTGTLMSLSQALAADLDLVNARIHERYESGLEIYINRDQLRNWTVTVEARMYALPPNGWVASNPARGLLNYSALVDPQGRPSHTGARVDYVRTPDYVMVDGRLASAPVYFGVAFSDKAIRSSGLMVVRSDGWTLSIRPDGAFEIADH